MKIFDLIATLHNWLSDKDFIWWPFSFLRPEKDVEMTFKLTTLMTLCFGGLGFVMFTIMSVMNNAVTMDSMVQIFLTLFLGFFVWFNAITKPIWNYRARKLRK